MTSTATTTATKGIFTLLRDERTVLIGLGVTAASFFCAMRFALEYYRDEVEIKPTQPKTQYITQDTEDSLRKGTLETLLQHYNFSIRETALKIVAGRAVNDTAAVKHLLRGITRPDYDERERCLKALAFAVEDVETYQDPLGVLNTPQGYRALVRSLELSLSDYEHEPLDDPLYDEYYLRDVNERRCLLLIYKLIHKYGVDRLIEAQFIERWLAQQPWTRDPKPKPKSEMNQNDDDDDNNENNNNNNKNNDNKNKNRNSNNDERLQNFARYLERKRNRISDICQHLTETRAGRRALVRARLLAKSKSKRPQRRRADRASDQIKVVLEISMADDDENDPGNRDDGALLRGEVFEGRSGITSSADDDDGDDEDVDEDDDFGDGGDDHSNILVPRLRVDQSAEEQRLRRRHREAMVLNDGTHPPGRGDIIEREHDSNG
ncbi:hypothetical protein MGN70_005429 [Eutypa lata]|nr:hypothetical protein MGN70_005429 [Eutypa lata]